MVIINIIYIYIYNVFSSLLSSLIKKLTFPTLADVFLDTVGLTKNVLYILLYCIFKLLSLLYAWYFLFEIEQCRSSPEV